jgi:hypothetical protein
MKTKAKDLLKNIWFLIQYHRSPTVAVFVVGFVLGLFL